MMSLMKCSPGGAAGASWDGGVFMGIILTLPGGPRANGEGEGVLARGEHAGELVVVLLVQRRGVGQGGDDQGFAAAVHLQRHLQGGGVAVFALPEGVGGAGGGVAGEPVEGLAAQGDDVAAGEVLA